MWRNGTYPVNNDRTPSGALCLDCGRRSGSHLLAPRGNRDEQFVFPECPDRREDCHWDHRDYVDNIAPMVSGETICLSCGNRASSHTRPSHMVRGPYNVCPLHDDPEPEVTVPQAVSEAKVDRGNGPGED